MNTENRILVPVVWIGCVNALILTAGIFLAYLFGKYEFLNVMVGLVAVVSFFGVLAAPGGWSGLGGFTENRVRLAVTSALVMVYLVYFATAVFWFGTDESDKLTGLRETLITTLTDLLKIVLPFYFTASAAAEITKIRANASASAKAEKGSASEKDGEAAAQT